jgi:hypothetical protein
MEKNTNIELTVAIKEVVKEALREVLAETGILAGKANVAVAKETVKEAVKDTAPAKEVAKETAKADTAKKDADPAPVAGDRAEELKGMKYNDLKALVSKLGGKAVGKAPDLIAQILELEAKAGSPAPEADKADEAEDTTPENNEEGSEDAEDNTQEFVDFLGELDKDALLEVGAKLEVKKPKAFKKEAYITLLVANLDALYSALEELGYYNEEGSEDAGDDAEGEDEEVSIADQLAEKSVEELAELCTENGLSAKGKKQALVDRLVKAVEAGEITLDGVDAEDTDAEDESSDEEAGEDDAWYTQEELEAMEVSELEGLAKEYEIEIPTKTVKKKKVTDKTALVEALVALGEADEDSEEAGDDSEDDGEEFEASQERLDKEGEIEDKIRAQYKAKKLKDATIKKFLEAYNDGEEVDLDKEEALDKYVEIKVAMVDDDAEVHEGEDCYIRNGEYFCCGKQLEEVDGAPYCTVCGTTYDAE